MDSLEKYRPHNFDLGKPKGDDINDLVDFYSNYRTKRSALGRVHGAGRLHDYDDELEPEPRRGGRIDPEPRKKFSDPEMSYRTERPDYRTAGNGFNDFESLDPATRLILEKARTTRSRPVEEFRNPYERDEMDEFSALRPPKGANILQNNFADFFIIYKKFYL